MNERYWLIRQTNGRIFRCEFIKKDGSVRRMLARTGVSKGTNGVGLKFSPEKHNLRVVYDVNKRAHRMVNVATLLSLHCGAIQWGI